MESAPATEPFRFEAGATNPPAAVAAARPADALVQETRREIAGIVREVAELARRDQPPTQFFAALVDRVARAMAAEGVVVWQRSDEEDVSFRAIARIGRKTDLNIQPPQRACHLRMLAEVAAEQQPVAVPPTPGATDDSLPANPSEVPVAIVPILEPTAASSEYLLEVFLEPEGGPATQRGYLRFAAQMADLAADFLRLHRIRRAQECERRWEHLSSRLPRLHGSLAADEVAAIVVDEAAELFEVDRASLCARRSRRVSLLAVSYVAQVNRKTDQARRIEAIADAVVVGQPLYHDHDQHRPHDDVTSPAVGSSDENTGRDGEETATTQRELQTQAAIAVGDAGDYVLVLQSMQPSRWEAATCRDLETFAIHADRALRNAATFEAVPWARAMAVFASPHRHTGAAARRQWLMLAALAVLSAVIASFPVPLVVQADGELYAANAQSIYAPRDAVVTEVLVEHGQPVEVDQVLLRMTDGALEQQYETLVGDQAVLLQRAAEFRGALLDQPTLRRQDSQRLQSEQRVIAEKIAAIDRQLVLLDNERKRLTLRSDRKGIVDGWQLRRNLIERPVQRGERLLSVIEPSGSWRIETRIPQNRIDMVLAAVQPSKSQEDKNVRQKPLHRVALHATPDHPVYAGFEQMGPVVDRGAEEGPAARASFSISELSLPQLQTGTPATVAIDCGYRPLLFVAFQDFIRTITGKVRLYL